MELPIKSAPYSFVPKKVYFLYAAVAKLADARDLKSDGILCF